MANPMLKAAIDYANRGWLVFPVHWIAKGKCSCGKDNCHSPGKHPLTKHGLKDATTDSSIISQWFSDWPQANIAIVTGKKSGLVVLDFDDKGQGLQIEAFQKKGQGNLPLTPTVDTGGGGRHFFFGHNGTEIRNAANLLDLPVDVRGEGGYVIAPPSVHISGNKYTWRINYATSKLSPLQPWLITVLKKRKPKLPQDKTVSLSEWSKLWNGVSEPGRNVAATRLAGRLLGLRMPREEVVAIMRAWDTRNSPPLGSELIQVINSIVQAEQRKPDHIGIMPAEYLLTSEEVIRPGDVLEGGLLPEGGCMILTGESGVGKSLLTLEIAVRLSKGMPLWDINAPSPRSILFIQKENPEYTVRIRLRNICRGLGVEYPERIFFADRRFKLTINDVRALAKIKEVIEKTKAEVVVLDPLSSYHGVNENDNIQMRRVLDHLTDLSGETGCSWIVVHHEGKPGDVKNKLSKWRFRGASSIRDWADTMIGYLWKANSEQKVMRILSFDKIRHGPDRPNLLLERDQNFVHHIIDEDLTVPLSLIADAFAELGGRAKSKAELCRTIGQWTDASRATIYRAIENAENRVWHQGEKELISLV